MSVTSNNWIIFLSFFWGAELNGWMDESNSTCETSRRKVTHMNPSYKWHRLAQNIITYHASASWVLAAPVRWLQGVGSWVCLDVGARTAVHEVTDAHTTPVTEGESVRTGRASRLLATCITHLKKYTSQVSKLHFNQITCLTIKQISNTPYFHTPGYDKHNKSGLSESRGLSKPIQWFYKFK